MIPSYANRVSPPLELKRISMGQLSADVVEIDGELYFYAPSLAVTLEHKDARDMLRGMPSDEKRLMKVFVPSALNADTSPALSAGAAGQIRDANLLTESGFYRLVLRSRSPVAEPFRKWVVCEVLPSIRKTGQYQIHRTANELGHQLNYSDVQWSWLKEHPCFVDIIPLALAGYNSVQITKKLGYKTSSGITARKQIEKLKALGFLPFKIKSRSQQLEEKILADRSGYLSLN